MIALFTMILTWPLWIGKVLFWSDFLPLTWLLQGCNIDPWTTMADLATFGMYSTGKDLAKGQFGSAIRDFGYGGVTRDVLGRPIGNALENAVVAASAAAPAFLGAPAAAGAGATAGAEGAAPGFVAGVEGGTAGAGGGDVLAGLGGLSDATMTAPSTAAGAGGGNALKAMLALQALQTAQGITGGAMTAPTADPQAALDAARASLQSKEQQDVLTALPRTSADLFARGGAGASPELLAGLLQAQGPGLDQQTILAIVQQYLKGGNA